MAQIRVLYQEFQQMCHSLEFTQQQINTLTKENKSLHLSVKNPTTLLPSIKNQLVSVPAEKKMMKETIIDLQSCSIRDNLFFRIPETLTDEPEKIIQEFMAKHLKPPAETVKQITLHIWDPADPIPSDPDPLLLNLNTKQK